MNSAARAKPDDLGVRRLLAIVIEPRYRVGLILWSNDKPIAARAALQRAAKIDRDRVLEMIAQDAVFQRQPAPDVLDGTKVENRGDAQLDQNPDAPAVKNGSDGE